MYSCHEHRELNLMKYIPPPNYAIAETLLLSTLRFPTISTTAMGGEGRLRSRTASAVARYFSSTQRLRRSDDEQQSDGQRQECADSPTGQRRFWDDFAFGDTWTSKGMWIVDARASWLVKQRRAELADQRGALSPMFGLH